MENILSWYNQKMDGAQFNRLGVMAFVLLVHTCLIIPPTILVMGISGFNPIAIGITTIFSFSILTAMIAGLPVKITLPLFAVSTVVHIIMIFLSLT